MSRTPETSGVEVDDRTVGGLLAYHALIEIRALAGKPSRQPGTVNTDEVLREIRTLADRAHNLPLGPRPRGRWRSIRARRASPRERAMRARPMSYTWDTTGEQGRAWMLRHISEAGYRWTPPPALPTAGEPAGGWSLRQLLRTLTGRRRWSGHPERLREHRSPDEPAEEVTASRATSRTSFP